MSKPSYLQIYVKLYEHYGPQSWWPAESTLEMLLGAILVQRTNWRNVEKALEQLPEIDAEYLYQLDEEDLATRIRPSGFYRMKAKRVKAWLTWFRRYHYNVGKVKELPHKELRQQLLSIYGIGEETADVMLLYAFDKPTFIADQYSMRILGRIGLKTPSTYRALQQEVEADVPMDLLLHQEYHALLVEHAKSYCRKKPICNTCPILEICKTGQNKVMERI